MKVLAVILIILGALICLGGIHSLTHNKLDHSQGGAYMIGEITGHLIFLAVGVIMIIAGSRLAGKRR